MQHVVLRWWCIPLLCCFLASLPLSAECAQETTKQTRAVGKKKAGKTSKGAPAKRAAKAERKSKAPQPEASGARQPSMYPPPLSQLMRSAGRDPLKKQPEEDFLLSVPDAAWAGEPFVLRMGGKGLQHVEIRWRDKSIVLQPGKNNQPPGMCEAILAVPLNAKADVELTITAAWREKTEIMHAVMPVQERDYPVQRLKVKPKYVTPPPEVLERIKADRKAVRQALSQITPVKYWALPFLRPVPGIVTSEYGLRRVFNGQERNPHKGIDFRAQEGDPVAACAPGIVALAEEHYYGGNTVIVDHGLGVFSMYLHLSAIHAQPGQKVEAGTTVGLIGSTGRSTGPHLHLSLAVLGDLVNAAPFITGMESHTTSTP